MIFPLLFTISLCALAHVAKAQPMQMTDLIPLEERVQIKHLPNGVKTYVQEHEDPRGHGSFRVVLKKPCSEEVLYRFDAMIDSIESVEQFFHYCRQRACAEITGGFQGLNFLESDLPAAGNSQPNEVAVVAVGDFSAGEVQSLIEKHFGGLNFSNMLSLKESSIGIGVDPELPNVGLSLNYSDEPKPLQTYEDLREVWKSLLLKDLFNQRLEICSRSLDHIWVHPYPRFFYPLNGYSLVPQELSENMLSYFLLQAETIRRDGFFEEEFQRAKQRALGRLQYLASQAEYPDDAYLASYYADQFLLGDCCPSAIAFMNASVEIVSGVQWQDIIAHAEPFFLEKNRHIHVTYPFEHDEMLTLAQVEQIANEIDSLASSSANSKATEDEIWFADESTEPLKRGDTPIISVDIDIPEGTEPYYQLPITDKEKRIIKIIVTTMAEKNILQLAFIKRTMEKKGKKIEHVHPMRFIGYVLSNAELRSCLRTIKKSSFKWDAFIDGFSRRMKEEFEDNNLYIHIDGFCHQVGANSGEVTHFIQKKDWEGLVKAYM